MQKHTFPNHRSLHRTLQFVLLAVLLSGCAVVTSNQKPTQADTPEETGSIAPTSELVPVEEITNLPTHAPTTTIEPQPVETSIIAGSEEIPPSSPEPPGSELDVLLGADATFAEAEILIKRPGQYSRITSPFQVIAYVGQDPDRLVQVTLVGEDGRTLVSKKVKPMPYLGLDNGNMITELSFEIEALSELGRLEISLADEFGRIQAFNSVDLILLSVGETDRNYTPEVQERLIIQYPLENYMIQGSSLLVSGLVRTSSQQPLSLTLVDENGNLTGQGSASVVLADGQDFGLFIGEVPFDVDTPIWVRLSVSIPGERIPGYIFIKTFEMVISP